MDSFGAGTNRNNLLIKDTLITSGNLAGRKNTEVHKAATEVQDSVDLSQKEITQIVNTIKAHKITDINQIKDVVTFRDVNNFNITALSDHQMSEILQSIRENIAERMAEMIYKTTHNGKFLEISSKERVLIDNILSRLHTSPVTNLNQAIEFVNKQSSENPGLVSKMSAHLINLVVPHNQTQQPQVLKQDAFTPNAIPVNVPASNPFKSNEVTRSQKPSSPEEAKEFLNQVINSKDRSSQAVNPQAISDMTNLILANYKRNNTAELIPDEIIKNQLKQTTTIDQVFYNENILAKNVNYLNDIAAKTATKNAHTIIKCRIIGEVVGSASCALGMATLVGSSPLLGIAGAMAITMMAAIVGMIIGKSVGEGAGKVFTNTKTDENLSKEEIEEHYKLLEEYKEQSNKKKQKDDSQNQDDEESTDEDEPETKPKTKHAFDYINEKVSEALKNRIIFNKKE